MSFTITFFQLKTFKIISSRLFRQQILQSFLTNFIYLSSFKSNALENFSSRKKTGITFRWLLIDQIICPEVKLFFFNHILYSIEHRPSSVGRPYITSLPETLDAAVDARLGRCDADQHQKRYHNERYWLHVWICESLFKQNDTICIGTRVSYWAAQLFNTTEQHCRSRKAIYIKQKKWTFDLSRLCVKYPSTQNLRKRQQSYQQHSGVNILTNSFHCKGGKIVNMSPKKPQMIYR